MNRLVRVYEGPVVGDPKLGQQLEGHCDIAPVGSQVRVGQHHIIDGPQQRNLVAYLRIVLMTLSEAMLIIKIQTG